MHADEDGVIQTYVFDNVEVRKTGRVARKQLKSGKIDEMFEITPVDTVVGSWKKWPREVELTPIL